MCHCGIPRTAIQEPAASDDETSPLGVAEAAEAEQDLLATPAPG